MGINMNIFHFSDKIIKIAEEAEKMISDKFTAIDETAFYNQMKVQKAFSDNRISTAHFNPTSGYGYDDEGRDSLDKVYADVFSCETALVRPNIISGTHALAVMLFSVLRPGDKLLSVTGSPYDTLTDVISGKNIGSLADFGINFEKIDLKDGHPDLLSIKKALADNTVKAVLIQRSKGYDLRPSLTIADIKELCIYIREVKSDTIILVDNCYGEFVETCEPVFVGADLMAGSLIKNPGGGLAPTGGYLAGKKDLIILAAHRLTAPGIGLDCGCNYGMIKQMYQGFYMAPHIVAQSLKTALFCAAAAKLLGYEISPDTEDTRSDIIQAIKFGNPESIIAFCRGIQKGSPVDSHVSPIPWAMPGYSDEVIMAAGAFNQGSSIEISADAPMREPYVIYMQGGLTYESGKLAVMFAFENVLSLEK